MDLIKNIRNLYNPIQPTVKQSAGNVTYQEFLPDQSIQSYIYCYWQLKTSRPLDDPFFYRVVADGCIDIFFELNNPEESFVMGFCKKYTEFQLDNSFNYVGVRFLPTMFPQLFRIDASELSNRFESLNLVIPQIAHFIETHFCPGIANPQIKIIFDKYFTELLHHVDSQPDPRLHNAISIILAKDGSVNIETGLDTGLSPRQLRRLFHFYIGDSAKTFSKVVRFQNILRGMPSQILHSGKSLMNGYYDQAHFIKEFTNLYGITPGKALDK
ncbi:DUF6597 domain-containing transcriptional factor [Dyadobacter arcticus]|uniref:AraC-like DNA-binding protein n=1 Tax=Dyadobacter arcticus TaxID=1078754 RepID=A0ABX0UW60_9BACT|nr:DUF6597 domain-containing transcriptional factor [Dyadobacter arcticus]NIJ55161.1 AraC-like DNA-binding protein [Dyadobacter arcticus]